MRRRGLLHWMMREMLSEVDVLPRALKQRYVCHLYWDLDIYDSISC